MVEVLNITISPVPTSTLFQLTFPSDPDLLFYVPGTTGEGEGEGERENPVISNRLTPLLALTIVRALCSALSWGAVLLVASYDRLQGTVTHRLTPDIHTCPSYSFTYQANFFPSEYLKKIDDFKTSTKSPSNGKA